MGSFLGQSSSSGATTAFSDPFLLPSSESMPTDFRTALDYCVFLYGLNPIYQRCAQRTCGYFITDCDFIDERGDPKEQKRWREFLHDDLKLFSHMAAAGDDWACLQGDTKVVTRGGVFKIRELTGWRVDVLSKDGIYRPADFRSHGVQPLVEVEFSDGRKVYATPEHKWEVKNGKGNIVEVTTEGLKPSSHRIKRTVAPRPEKDDDYFEGVRHGFVFGDGNLSNLNAENKTTSSSASFYGEKDAAMESFFADHPNPIHPRADRKNCRRSHGWPACYKELPQNEASASYWYGFVSGLLAADGCVDARDGCVVLTQCDRKVLEAVEEQLPRIGMVAGPIRSQIRDTEIGGRTYKDHEIFFMTLLKQFMLPDDSLLPEHRKNFMTHWNPESTYGQWMGIQAVRDTDRYEEVFCCTEMETHRLVIENGVLTGNCFGNAFSRLYFPFVRTLVDRRDQFRKEYALNIWDNIPDGIKYDYQTLEYDVVDPKTMGRATSKWERIKLKPIDRDSSDWKRIKILPLWPQQVILSHSIMSGTTQICWEIDRNLVQDVRGSVLRQVNDTPLDILHAIAKDQNYEFREGEVFHLKNPTVSGITNGGWGIPEVLRNYRNIHQLQVFRKIDEAIGLDYVLPFRVFTPGVPTTDFNQATTRMALSEWRKHTAEMVRRRRLNPVSMYAMPMPLQMQSFGHENSTLVSKDQIGWHTDHLLDGMGHPAQLFHGTLALDATPTALRMFENQFYFLYHGYNDQLNWSSDKIRNFLGLEPLNLRLQRPSMVDHIEKQSMLLQMLSAGELPRSEAWKSILNGRDPVSLIRDKVVEDLSAQRVQMEEQTKFEREQALGSLNERVQAEQAGAAGGAPAAGAMTPLDRMDEARQVAMEMLAIPYVGERQKALRQLEASDPQKHALVKAEMEKRRSQGEAAGRQSVQGDGQGMQG